MPRRSKTKAAPAPPKDIPGASYTPPAAPSTQPAPAPPNGPAVGHYSTSKPKNIITLATFNAQFDKAAPNALQNATVYAPPGAVCPLINTPGQVKALVDHIQTTLSVVKLWEPPSLYLSLSGQNLGRNGTISTLQIFIRPVKTVLIVDVTALGNAAFTTPGSDHVTTLKDYLEVKTISKVFFDCRNASNALYYLYGIKLRGVVDIQLMKNSLNSADNLMDLDACIYFDLGLTPSEWDAVADILGLAKKLLMPELGGSEKMFDVRPFPPALVRSTILNVVLLKDLYMRFNQLIPNDNCKRNLDFATKARLLRSQSEAYVPQTRDLLGVRDGVWNGSAGPEALSWVVAAEWDEAFEAEVRKEPYMKRVKEWIEAEY